MGGLGPQPVAGTEAQKSAEAQIGVGGDRPLARHDFAFDSIRASSGPDEAEAELVVDADAVLACAITPQGLQPVARRNAQVVQTACDLQRPELAAGHALNELEPGHGPALGQSCGVRHMKEDIFY